MQELNDYLTCRRRQLQQHGFFKALQLKGTHLADFAPPLTFWVMAFQDMLRLNAARVVDPHLRQIAETHQAEDFGHQLWFLDDLEEIGAVCPNANMLFGPSHTSVRDASFSLLGEVFRDQPDVMRIVLLLSVESAGHEFFTQTSQFVAHTLPNTTIQYFGVSHLEVELDHDFYDDQSGEILDMQSIHIDDALRPEAYALVDRVYAAFNEMFDGLLQAIQAASDLCRAA